jgi:hypothetical protein
VENGDVDLGLLMMGQSIEPIRDLPTFRGLLGNRVREAVKTLAAMGTTMGLEVENG